MLFDPAAHERLVDAAWSPDAARRAISAIAADAEAAFDPRALWALHPHDAEPGDPERVHSLYLGAAGTVWALARLGERDWAPVAARRHERYLSQPDFGEAVPGLWMGESGILLVAWLLAPSAQVADRLADRVAANTDNPTNELMWGAPGTLLAASAMLARTGEPRWAELWRAGAQRLWALWDGVWTQDLYGRRQGYLGPAHGFAGNVLALAQHPELLPSADELLARTASAVREHAVVSDGHANWPPVAAAPLGDPVRVQWCHGAPGMVASLAGLPPHAELDALLLAGGELTWDAGPLAKGAGLCHGTAGSGFAFLKLFARTGDERWLARARAFAMHAIAQVERERARFSRGRYSLWTGDPGTALYLEQCLAGGADFPTLDVW